MTVRTRAAGEKKPENGVATGIGSEQTTVPTSLKEVLVITLHLREGEDEFDDACVPSSTNIDHIAR